MDFVLATKNRKKIREMKNILNRADPDSRIYTLDDFPEYGDVVEDGDTFEANALKKAEFIAAKTGMAAIADDSGLEVDALGGAPGVYSARYAGEPADDTANNRKLLDELKDIPDEKRGARFVCCIALAHNGEVHTFTGYIKGRLGRENRGHNGFGYDPLFFPEGHDRTFAEMADDEKNVISHRALALRELQNYLEEKTAKKRKDK
ncbi:MAG: XTP/dITP diphosphatase [Nitrospirae bacterium]|nr:XTP/dITP diphosphatase [Nitrospirota bacterium]